MFPCPRSPCPPFCTPIDDDFSRDHQIAQLRIPPHSSRPSQSVLGGLLLDNGAWDRVGDLLTDSDFYRYEHRLIYAAIGGADQRHPAGRRDHGLRAAAGPGQGGGGAAAWPTSTRWRSTCRAPATSAATPRSCASARSCASWSSASDEIATAAFNTAGQAGRQDPGRGRAEDLQHRRGRLADEAGLPGHGSAWWCSCWTGSRRWPTTPTTSRACRTGFYDLDRMTSGMQAGDMIVLAARPSMGKTALAINIAEHVALNEGLPVAVFSMEMGASQLAVRIVGSIGRIDQMHLRTGKLTRRGVAAPDGGDREAAQHLAAHRRNAGLTTSELRANARRLARQCGKLGLIVVDYLQLMSVSSSMSEENRATGRRRDLARPEDARQGAAVPGDRAVAAQPRRRVAHRQAADDERPARIRRDRAGRRRDHVHLPRRLLQQGLARSPASPRSSSASSATAPPGPSSSPS